MKEGLPNKGSFFLELDHKRGDIVYLKTDTAQQPYIVIGYVIEAGVKYILSSCGEISYHEGFEINKNLDEQLMREWDELEDDEEDGLV
jgi:hypothetical protein